MSPFAPIKVQSSNFNFLMKCCTDDKKWRLTHFALASKSLDIVHVAGFGHVIAMDLRTALRVLGLGQTYSKEDVVKAYRRLVRPYHPDNLPVTRTMGLQQQS